MYGVGGEGDAKRFGWNGEGGVNASPGDSVGLVQGLSLIAFRRNGLLAISAGERL